MPLVPNLLPQLALVALVPLAGARLAERLILLGYVLAVSFAMLWALRQTRLSRPNSRR